MDAQRTQCNSDLKNRIKVQPMIVPPTSPIAIQNYVVFFFHISESYGSKKDNAKI